MGTVEHPHNEHNNITNKMIMLFFIESPPLLRIVSGASAFHVIKQIFLYIAYVALGA